VEGYLLDALERAGARCLTEAAFELGVPRLLEFERAVQQSRRTLLVLSPAYLAENFAQFTDLLTQHYGLETATWPVIPLILAPDLKLPPRLAMLIALDATDPAGWPAAIERLCAVLRRPVQPSPPPPPCPYPGMSSFTEADAGRFFGREREVQELLERLRLHRFLAVIGPSGCGKSSLVFAGLIPALRKSTLFGPGEWSVKSMRPGEWADSRPPLLATGDLRLLIVDQFEELFTHAAKDAVPFQEELLRLARTPDCYVVLTARADFYPDLMASPLWPEIQAHRMEVLPLDADGLRQAIVRPAENVGVYVEAALVERLVADAAGEPGMLPFVQETLVLLWERLERRFLPLRAYEALILPLGAYRAAGDVRRTGLQVAMARRADAALGDLTPVQQAIARRIFLRLIQFGEGRADTRRRQPVAALRSADDRPEEFDRTLEQLVHCRLLTLSGEAETARPAESPPSPVMAGKGITQHASARSLPVGRITADIAHEALITGWPTLQQWVQEGRAAELTRRRVERAAEEWSQHHRDASYLYRGIRLAEAQAWAASSAAELSETVQAFLAASQRYADLLKYARLVALAALVLLAAIPPFQWVREYLWRQAASGPMAVFPAGPALLGSDDDPTSRAYPRRKVELPAFSLDLHEVTYGQYRLCVKAGRCSLPLEPADEPGIATADERLPVVWVNAYQAADFCRWLGRRLPSEAEWERAARGTEGRRWPWPGGEEPTPRHVNLFLPNYLQDAPTGPVAADDPVFAAGATPEGIMHMIGNVWEWTSTSHLCKDTPYDCPTLWNGRDKVQALFLRGMSWTHDLAPVTYALDASPIVAANDFGFRCARSERSRR
jgi:formylglycine-generating enzyme required for sulfatase activity